MQELRTCTICKLEKRIEEYNRCGNKNQPGIFYRRVCRRCVNDRQATGKPNTGRFKKGIIPPTSWKKGRIPWNKGMAKPKPVKEKKIRIRVYKNVGRWSSPARRWRREVIKRDGICMKCGSINTLEAHHIKSWKDNEFLRFELTNGITLCRSCHINIHKPQRVGQPGSMKGKKHSEESRKKMSESAKGRIPWNKGIQIGNKFKNKKKELTNEHK